MATNFRVNITTNAKKIRKYLGKNITEEDFQKFCKSAIASALFNKQLAFQPKEKNKNTFL